MNEGLKQREEFKRRIKELIPKIKELADNKELIKKITIGFDIIDTATNELAGHNIFIGSWDSTTNKENILHEVLFSDKTYQQVYVKLGLLKDDLFVFMQDNLDTATTRENRVLQLAYKNIDYTKNLYKSLLFETGSEYKAFYTNTIDKVGTYLTLIETYL